MPTPAATPREPTFARFAPPVAPRTALREAITAACRRSEPECVAPLLDAARPPDDAKAAIAATARALVEALRARHRPEGVEGLVHEYALSSQEGVALMCLAEALLRIPDTATRDALIRDKIAGGDWAAHMGGGRSLFVNAASWGLVVTGRLTGASEAHGLSAALTRLLARAGEPVIRRGMDMAMRLMGEQFVTGETIAEALRRARPLEARGFRHSYDMLGEAATTAEDAARYLAAYTKAIDAIGAEAAGRGIHAGPGISAKLSALHPRYGRAQAERVMAELLPRLRGLAIQARDHGIGLNIDAEEADRLDLSLDLLEALSLDPALAGWDGLGFVVQAYGRRCPFVIDFLIHLARRSGRRLMVRLVKGAYWDAEIKRAQVDGMADFPVFTRKVHTDVSYLACARQLLAAPEAVFPQFATHNAQTVARIHHMAGPDFHAGQYEFQCLHGMGEPLYEEVMARLHRPCRIYAPVGTHETLLAYLVRRLLENGANASFVHRIADAAVPVEDLVADPVEVAEALPVIGAPHPAIAAPAALYGARANSQGIDLADEARLAALSEALAASAARPLAAGPLLADGSTPGTARPVRNPADHADVVGHVREVPPADVPRIAALAAEAAADWAAVPVATRAACLDRAAEAMQARMAQLMGILMREAGKSAANAIGEVREAIDFLRYYAAEARATLWPRQRPLGAVVCISPWNFPLAIFTGQVAAALAAGNSVMAKPAEETPLIAQAAVEILHAAGIPRGALQLVPGDGATGAALVAARETAGVLFTGSTAVARLIQAELAQRLSPSGKPIPLIAETGGQNVMIVDSSALREQVVGDVIASAFDSAGQRCSALRVLCLQEEVAEPILAMLRGAMRELAVGRPDRLSTDVGPVISAEAKAGIEDHIAHMRARGHKVEQLALPAESAHGTFVAPMLIEILRMDDLTREVFGPVLHVIRYRRADLDRLLADINASGYGLTFGLHTRIDETVSHVAERVKAGNLYINRNMIGAVVGVQPFGGRGLSGTGPKAGGPLYLGRLVEVPPPPPGVGTGPTDSALAAFAGWLAARGHLEDAAAARDFAARSALGHRQELAGPVGERNVYALHPRGRILLVPVTQAGLMRQLAAALATGNTVAIDKACGLAEALAGLPERVAARVRWTADWAADGPFAGALLEGDGETVRRLSRRIATLPGPLVPVQAAGSEALAQERDALCLAWLLEEVTISTNTTAAGGNASLMAIG